MASMRVARARRYAPAWGLALLVLGISVAVIRYNHAIEAYEAQHARYEDALRQAAAQPARFEVSYVQVSLPAFRRVADGKYTIVDTEVARRIETGRPALHPDFAVLAGRRTDRIARALQNAVPPAKGWVAGLLVRPTMLGDAVGVRLEVERVAIDGFTFTSVDSAGVLFPPRKGFDGSGVLRKQKDSVMWTPRTGETVLIPLAVLHEVEI
jgi:hypothetical protein